MHFDRDYYSLESYNNVMRASAQEQEAKCKIEGSVPEALLGGTYYLNGPGMMELGGRLMHPFDGHGYIRSLRFEDTNEVTFRSRFVNTDSYQAESQAGKLVYRGFGTLLGSWLENVRAPDYKNVSNTCIVPWGEDLLTLWEGGRPYSLNPNTLDTKQLQTYDGAFQPMKPVLAHTRFDAQQDRLVFLSPTMGAQMNFTFFEVDKKGEILQTRSHKCWGVTFIHDFLITPNYYVILTNPVKASLLKFLKSKLAMGTLIESIQPGTTPSRILLIPRNESGQVHDIPLDKNLFAFHHGDAYETYAEDGSLSKVVFHSCVFEKPFSFGNEFGFQGPHKPLDPGSPEPGDHQLLTRIEVDVQNQVATRRVVSPSSVDFPRVHPDRDGLQCRYLYAGTTDKDGISTPMTALAKVDLEREVTTLWSTKDGSFVGEPVFAPNPGSTEESDGWVIMMVYNGIEKTSKLCIFCADDIQEGPIATIHAPAFQPYGFHGNWAPPA